MASISVLERKIDRQIKENTDQMKSFKSELQCLRKTPKPQIFRPCSDLTKPKEVIKSKKLEVSCKAQTNLVKNAVAASMPSINMNSPKKSASFGVCDLFQFVVNETFFHRPQFL